jgi:hypothetical protein
MSAPAIPVPTTLETALVLRRQGIAAIPCRADKKPCGPWGEWEDALPPEDVLRAWFGDGRSSLGIVGGEVQCLDLDAKHAPGLVERFEDRAKAFGLEPLLARLLNETTKPPMTSLP